MNAARASSHVIVPMLALLCLGCSADLRRSNVQFQEGRITMDWPRRGQGLDEQQQVAFEGKLAKRIDLLRAKLRDATIVSALRASNARTRDLTLEDFLKLDHRYQNATGDDPFLAQSIDGACSDVLTRFSQSFAGFAEIFVTDAQGLNVCQTNRTSDYYQADEQWWLDAFEQPSRRPVIGKIGYDQSAEVYAIPVAIAVTDPDSGEPIGVGKGVIRQGAGD